MLFNLIKKINSTLAKGLECKSNNSDNAQKSYFKRKSGFTIVELMVVIIMVNLLSGVAIPKCTGLIEKSKERIDMLKLYYLRDAMDRALYEDNVNNFAHNNSNKCPANSEENLSKYLKQKLGVSLFVIEIHAEAHANYQGIHKDASGNNMCGLLVGGGFWNNALKEAGMEAVADIVADRAAGDKFNYNSTTYTTETYATNKWTRTYPTNELFKSGVLNGTSDAYYKKNLSKQKRYTMRVRWLNCDENSHSVEVFLYDESSKKPVQGQFTTFFTGSNFNSSKCK